MSVTAAASGTATNTPRFGSRTSNRSPVSSTKASRTVLRDTPNACPMASSGIREPGRKWPSLTCSRRASATRAAVGTCTTRTRASLSARIASVMAGPADGLRLRRHRGTLPHCDLRIVEQSSDVREGSPTTPSPVRAALISSSDEQIQELRSSSAEQIELSSSSAEQQFRVQYRVPVPSSSTRVQYRVRTEFQYRPLGACTRCPKST